MDKQYIGNKISSVRKKRGLTQSALAEQLHVTDKTVSKWETGTHFPDISMLEPLAVALDISVSELLGLEDATPEKAIKTVSHISSEEKSAIKKRVLSIAFLLSLLPMLLHQYGGARDVQEITGLINLLNPIGLLSVALFFVGVWAPFKSHRIGKVLCVAGTVGIVLAEIYKFLTWHIQNVTGEFSLYASFRFAFPEFYVGLFISLSMVAALFVLNRIIRD